jgi:hypothetical protein
MKIMSDLDYVVLYASKLKEDNRLFAQQKRLIENQIKASSSLFKNAFGREFKENARKYLRSIKLID